MAAPQTLSEKIIASHLVSGTMKLGEEIAVSIDQTLTHDVTGTMAYLGFETLGIPKVKPEVAVSYVEHNLVQGDFKNMDDHKYLQSVAKKYGLIYSRAGNGICHPVHFHRFGIPGKILLGSDSHTPTCSAVGMLSIGAGGLDVALAMAGEPFYLKMPEIVEVRLTGKRKPGVAAKDVILEMLRRYSVKGGLGKIYEYTGPGLADLDISERSTIANMGAEMGATTSIFPSDEMVRKFFIAQKREKDWLPLAADPGAKYAETIEIDLGSLDPMVAQPHMPDNVVKIKDLPKTKVDQVFIGSCTNASYADLVKAAKILDGKVVHPDVSFSVSAATRQILEMLMRDGWMQKLIASGARLMECGCGACVGLGQAPNSGAVSVRTSNRNFKGRSGTFDANVYIASPEVAAATALLGYIAEPSEAIDPKEFSSLRDPDDFIVDDRMLVHPPADGSDVELYRGPNIKPMPINDAMAENIEAAVAIKRPDNVTTDDITPAGAAFSALRSNIPAISEITFGRVDPGFVERIKKLGKGFIVGAENYGQGSSREHAAIAPMYLGIKAVIAKSMARIHKANLVNYGIMPLIFADKSAYDGIDEGDMLVIENAPAQARTRKVTVKNKTKGTSFGTVLELSDREIEMIIAGGALPYVKNKAQKK